MVDIQQAISIDVALAASRTSLEGVGVVITVVIAVGAAVLGFATCYLALRGVARWCPDCGGGLSCAACDRSRTRVSAATMEQVQR